MGYIENLRKVAGNQPLILVGTAVAVFNSDGEILLQKRRDGLWGVPRGFMELGESTEANFFSINQLPEGLNPMIKKLIKQYTFSN